MEQKYSYYKKRPITNFDFDKKNFFNAQNALKNHFLRTYPIVYTDDRTDLAQVSKSAGYTDYVWLVDKSITVEKTFPWWFTPPALTEATVFQFPYVYKSSKKVKEWNMVQLVSTNAANHVFSKQRNICGVYDAYYGKERFDMFFLSNQFSAVPAHIVDRFSNIQLVRTIEEAQATASTDMIWIISDDVTVNPTFRFDYEPDDWSFSYVHVFLNGKKNQFDGIFLMPRNYNCSERELKYRFFADRKEVYIIASYPKSYDIFVIDTYDEYLNALETTTTEMFWMTSKYLHLDEKFKFDFYISHHNTVDKNETHAFIHRVNNQDLYTGIFLLSKYKVLSKKEIEFRSPIERKEWNIVASTPKPYDKFYIDTYDQYLESLDSSSTELFWTVPGDVVVADDFTFDIYFEHSNTYDRKMNHVFLNGDEYTGIMLMSKHKQVSKKEFEQRFLVERKEWDIVASTPRPYAIYK